MHEAARPQQQLPFDTSDFDLAGVPDDTAGGAAVRAWYAGLFAELLEQQRAHLERLGALEAKCESLRARVCEYRNRVAVLEAESDMLRAELRDARQPPVARDSWRSEDPLAVAG